ncbi:hypothetical protein C8R45DRAFT_1134934 [Mycena sanguinolenta]|nr:hypothetical protein C8R45DRAFT_1134934 [Mycena sanguinolenta]
MPIRLSSTSFLRSAALISSYMSPMGRYRYLHPSLWTSIRCESVTDAVNLDIWLQRARSLPLSISVHGNLDPDVASAFKKHAHQLQILDIEFRHFKQLITPLPWLQKLTIGSAKVELAPLRECIDILRAAPALMECNFVWTLMYPRDAEPLTRPFMRRFRVDGSVQSTNAAYMFKYLTLPALEILYIAGSDFVSAEFAAFLIRSSPPVRFLRIRMGNHDLNQSLRLVPTVTNLALRFSDPTIDPFPRCKPRLRKLHIHVPFTHNADYDALIAGLAARRAASYPPLQSFTLTSPNPKPHSDTIVTLRQFPADSGMRIHVGTHTCNYI